MTDAELAAIEAFYEDVRKRVNANADRVLGEGSATDEEGDWATAIAAVAAKM